PIAPARVDAEVRLADDDRPRRRHRNPAAPGRDLPPLPLRLQELLDGVDPAAPRAGARATRVRDHFALAGAGAPRSPDLPPAASVPDGPGKRPVPGSVVLRDAPYRDRARAPDVSVAQGMGRRVQHRRRGLLARDRVPR